MLSARLAETIANFMDRPVEMVDDQELVEDQRALVSYSLLVFCIQNGEYTNINWVTKKVGCIGMEAIGSTSRHFSSDI